MNETKAFQILSIYTNAVKDFLIFLMTFLMFVVLINPSKTMFLIVLITLFSYSVCKGYEASKEVFEILGWEV